MTRFSEPTLQKLEQHIDKLQRATSLHKLSRNKQIYYQSIKKNFYRAKLFTKNKRLAKALLIDLIFLNLELAEIKQKHSLLLRKLLLINKSIFTTSEAFTTTYLTSNDLFLSTKPLITDKLQILKKYHLKKKLQIFLKDSKFFIKNVNNKRKIIYKKIRHNIIGKLHIFFSRLCVLTLIHIIPFIQLSTSLFYTQANRRVVHPVLCYLLNFIPFSIQLLNITMPIVNHNDFSFLLVGLYFQVFVVHFKQYKIPRKFAYQGTFALGLMLLNYCMIINREILVVLYKFIRRFFFINNQKIDLLRDDFSCYLDDLLDFRQNQEIYLQYNERIFSLEAITHVTKIYEAYTIIPLLGLIALLYNCVYFIIKGQKPIIPLVTKTVRRTMVDRNGTEYE